MNGNTEVWTWRYGKPMQDRLRTITSHDTDFFLTARECWLDYAEKEAAEAARKESAAAETRAREAEARRNAETCQP